MTEELKPWQKGVPLDVLKRYAAIFKEHDKGIVQSPFTAYREREIASAMTEPGHFLVVDQDAGAAIHFVIPKQDRTIKDFAGEKRARVKKGDGIIKRVACRQGYEGSLLELCREHADVGSERTWWELWAEHPVDRRIAVELGLSLVCEKIAASAEITHIYSDPPAEVVDARYCDDRTLTRLDWLDAEFAAVMLEPAILALDRVANWADHYSSYNKGHSWKALALRGYSDDPAVILKPAEMSKKWKSENPDMLDATLRDTALRPALPELEHLILSIPEPHHRVRLMSLEPGGGELLRHADNTDPDAGVGPGQLLRIHIPLITNPRVLFNAWDLDGALLGCNMEAGEAWYLDTRKPHRAVNAGNTQRVHLVIDAEATPDLLKMVGAGMEAPLTRGSLEVPETVVDKVTIGGIEW